MENAALVGDATASQGQGLVMKYSSYPVSPPSHDPEEDQDMTSRSCSVAELAGRPRAELLQRGIERDRGVCMAKRVREQELARASSY